MIVLASLLDGEETEEVEATPPVKQRSELLSETCRDAEADAIRHAEDLLQQEFPIVVKAERTAETRLADLRTRYLADLATLQGEDRLFRERLKASEQRLQWAEAALRGKGVREDELRLPPQQRRRFELRQVVVAAAAAAVLGLVLAKLGSVPLPLVLVLLVGISLILWLTLAPVEETEPAEITRLRENWFEAETAKRESQEGLAQNDTAIERLERTTYAAGQSEIAFAGELVSAYSNAAFSALPAGTLEGGRRVAPQREPRVELPDWLQALAPEDE